MLNTLVLASAVIVIVLIIRPRRSSFSGHCEALIARLHRSELEGISDFIDDDDKTFGPDRGFWKGSDGIPGLLRRWSNMTVIVRLAQLHYREGRISREDALHIFKRASVLSFFTILAMPEALVCRLWGNIPHVYAQAAASSYCNLATRLFVICATNDAPKCVSQLSGLL